MTRAARARTSCSARSGRIRAALGADEGSILPLVVACAALALAVVFLATAATSLYLERKRLFTVADAAALVGAESFALDDVHADGGQLAVGLDSAEVRAAVLDYLAERSTGASAAQAFDTLTCDEAVADGGSARVTLSARWRPPVLAPLVPDGIAVTVTSTARSVLR
ncbi:pilus assembly protein TadG-related protein [Galbitalea sp. SE-J8]|uniref:pilus assembly protein TadG-related protein n=1 Tax=Galbitalea sp. SE-J8 TaxID=3054952 RepID=UPI00259D00AA|nr:pilus assembly protein TadG-related protein [Galbitalea sp. SE-J8]MDM4764113.1 pilus assembly protein TadG-related protein [Galbitalea sp. SE-J8]